MTTIEGAVTEIKFRNEDNGFSVIRFKADGLPDPIVCVGVLTAIERGQALRVNGEWEKHKSFGPQFAVKSFEIVRPTTLEGIETLLGSGLIASMGRSRAKKIIAVFGLETLNILDKEPGRLLEVSGIGKKICGTIQEAWQAQKHIRDLMLFLQESSISVNLAHKIYKTYGVGARERISANPYCLIDDIWGIGFTKADNIAQKLGFTHDSFKRIRAGLLHIMNESQAEGHTYLPKAELVEKAVKLLGVKEELVLFSFDHCTAENTFINEEDRIFQPALFEAEQTVADLLARKAAARNTVVASYDPKVMDEWLAAYCRRSGWDAAPQQLDAVRLICRHSVALLTGGPGTGKTTTLQMIVSFFREHHIGIALAAPTGRAAQRMGNIAGIKASTIHRLLEFKPVNGRFQFSRNADRPLEASVLIVDEVSMVDILLMRSFLSALRRDAIVLFVGDSNQLPSVGPGNVLADMIGSGRIPHIQLTTIFRQAAQSRIVTAAHDIIRGTVPIFSNDKDSNCFFIPEDDPERCVATVVELVKTRLPRRFGFDPVYDIQVLSPMHRGPLGTQNLNHALQLALASGGKTLVRGETSFGVGDRVMQLRNNYDRGVFNGDIGYVVDCIDEQELVVEFDGQPVRYELKDLDELVHAYCISIHKSQGCEFKAVVIVMTTHHYILLQRNLLYTAVTRAKQLCVLIGSLQAISIAVRNNEAFHRYCRLRDRIQRNKQP
jgi:exodeoxyribonuclease V alpha subunit